MILERFKVPATDQVRVAEAALRQTVTRIFEKIGLSHEDAAEGTDVLVMTDLRGVESHGVSNMLRVYVRGYTGGTLNPRPNWRIIRESPSTATIDADKGLGVIKGPKAMRLAIEKALVLPSIPEVRNDYGNLLSTGIADGIRRSVQLAAAQPPTKTLH